MSGIVSTPSDPSACSYAWPPIQPAAEVTTEANRSLLIGLGNPLLSDDAVGLLVAQRVHTLLNLPGLDLRELAVGGVELMETLIGYSRGVIIDAIITPDGKPGDLYQLDIWNCPPTRHTCMSHEIDLLDGLRLAQQLRLPVPGRLHLYAIEVADPFTFGNRMTERVKRSIPRIASKIAMELRPLLQK
jgi:hydrogenase maturation protease